MAKKTARKTAKKSTSTVAATQGVGNQLTTTILQNGAANYTVDNADVLAIAVSRAENTCNTEIAKAAKVVTALEKSERELADKTQKGINDEFQKAGDVALQPMRNLMEGRGLKVEFSHIYQGKGDDGIIRGQSNLTGQRTEKRPNGHHGSATATIDIVVEKLTYLLQVSVPQSAEVAQREAELVTLRAELQKARGVLGHWRVQKANIPALERQVKANLAEARLRETVAGREILDNMASTLQTQLLAGPTLDV